MINGIMNIYKEAGYTSHDVVAKLRGIVGQKKIGHTGTLDPDAVGVLPVCFGSATKLCDMMTDKSKEYEALMRLGVTTDTQDMSGTILTESAVHVNGSEVRDAVMGFVGGYEQVPPMYSALKVNGKKLYELAREGREIERQPRHVDITFIRITGMDLPEVRFEVGCSKGTYIRTLCADIGDKLGCGAVMAEGAAVKPEAESALLNGNKLYPQQLDPDSPVFFADGDRIRVYNGRREFRAVYTYVKSEGVFKPFKMFLE